jgi:type IV pilus assembly protein PilO
MAAKFSTSVNPAAALRGLRAQFQGLDTRDPASWPSVPKFAVYVVAVVATVAILWLVLLRGFEENLGNARAKEGKLRTDYQTKIQRAASLAALKKQREQVQQYVNILEKQLPNKAEMDALLSDINQAGLGRSLQFDWFRPNEVKVRDYYAELPISLKVTGDYNDIGAFTADIANLSRIVTLNDISVKRVANDKDKSGALEMEAIAKTFRYLDADEIAAQRAAAQKSKGKK